MLKYVTASFVLMQTSVSVQPSLHPAALIPVLFATKARFGIVQTGNRARHRVPPSIAE